MLHKNCTYIYEQILCDQLKEYLHYVYIKNTPEINQWYSMLKLEKHDHWKLVCRSTHNNFSLFHAETNKKRISQWWLIHTHQPAWSTSRRRKLLQSGDSRSRLTWCSITFLSTTYSQNLSCTEKYNCNIDRFNIE